jgi:DNA modification methylase
MPSRTVNAGRYAVHPFPARMAPELAFESLRYLTVGSIVLDPMSGSGTVLRQANDLGLSAIGFDMDPLAVLMSRVWTTPVPDEAIGSTSQFVIQEARRVKDCDVRLEWMDDDSETTSFVKFWFGKKQIRQLRKISFVLQCLPATQSNSTRAELDVLRIALSRIIITKEQSASLARDTSHSRPHRVSEASEFCCFEGFERSVKAVRARLLSSPPSGGTRIGLGDARKIRLRSRSVDAVLTSPPYLNAIDYMRGHRMSLVWLGYRLSKLREIRSNAIGAERCADVASAHVERAMMMMGEIHELPARHRQMIDRYIVDIQGMMNEIARVLKPRRKAILIVGNSCLRGVFISNSNLVKHAGTKAGLTLAKSEERVLPERNRYLPTNVSGALSKRMRTETVITFAS